MKKFLFIGLVLSASAVVVLSCQARGNRLLYINKDIKLPQIQNVIYFEPEVFPAIDEIKEPTNTAFFDAASNKLKILGDYRLLRVNANIEYDHVDTEIVKEFCGNNNAEIAIVPKVKYFKVGLGKYVFSNQVIVSMKLYNAKGEFVAETSYDTYKANARLLGTAENSIKIGTDGAIGKMSKELRARNMVYRKPLL